MSRGCCGKTQTLTGLGPQGLAPHSPGGCEVQGQGASPLGVWSGPHFWLRGLSSRCLQAIEVLLALQPLRARAPFLVALDPMASERPHLPMPSHWGLDVSRRTDLGDTTIQSAAGSMLRKSGCPRGRRECGGGGDLGDWCPWRGGHHGTLLGRRCGLTSALLGGRAGQEQKAWSAPAQGATGQGTGRVGRPGRWASWVDTHGGTQVARAAGSAVWPWPVLGEVAGRAVSETCPCVTWLRHLGVRDQTGQAWGGAWASRGRVGRWWLSAEAARSQEGTPGNEKDACAGGHLDVP